MPCQGVLRTLQKTIVLWPKNYTLPASVLVDQLQDLVLKTQDAKEVLDELVRFIAAALGDTAAFCSIKLLQQKKPVTVASSEPGAVRLDETQYHAGAGPPLGDRAAGRGAYT